MNTFFHQEAAFDPHKDASVLFELAADVPAASLLEEGQFLDPEILFLIFRLHPQGNKVPKTAS